MKKFRILCLAIMILALAAAMSGCSGLPFVDRMERYIEANTPSTPSPTPVATPEPVAATPAPDAGAIYSDILNRYRTAAAAMWDMTQLTDAGLNYMAAYAYGSDPLNRIGYCRMDYDGDGVEELLIGCCTGDSYTDQIVLEMYTISNGQPVQVFTSGERDRYYICSDRIIANDGSSSAYESSSSYYDFTGGELKFREGVEFNMTVDKNNPWFYVDASGAKSGMEESAALAITEAAQAKYISLAYTPLSQLEG